LSQQYTTLKGRHILSYVRYISQVPYTQVAYPTVEMNRKFRLEAFSQPSYDMGKDGYIPELLLLTHPPHISTILFSVALHCATSEFLSDRSTNIELIGLKSLVRHLELRHKIISYRWKSVCRLHSTGKMYKNGLKMLKTRLPSKISEESNDKRT
jgi:hypothetical protein